MLPSVRKVCEALVRSCLLSTGAVRALGKRWRAEGHGAPDVGRFLKWLAAKQYVTVYQAVQALQAFPTEPVEVKLVPHGKPGPPSYVPEGPPSDPDRKPDFAEPETFEWFGLSPERPAGRARSHNGACPLNRRECLALVIGAGGLLLAEALGWLLAQWFVLK